MSDMSTPVRSSIITLCNSPFKLNEELCGENNALLNLSMILLLGLGLRVGGS